MQLLFLFPTVSGEPECGSNIEMMQFMQRPLTPDPSPNISCWKHRATQDTCLITG